MEFVESDVIKIKRIVNYPTDKKKAHQILKEAIVLDGSDYKSLYQIGCDYLAGAGRTGVKSQDFELAYEYFNRALSLAKKEGASTYVPIIEAELDVVKKLLNNGK